MKSNKMDEELKVNQSFDIKLPLAALFVLMLLLVISLILGAKSLREDNSTPSEAARIFPQVDVNARAAYVYDIRNDRVLYAKNEDVRLPLASITKLMSALVAMEIGQPYSVVTINDEAIEAAGQSGLRAQEKWTLRDLIDFSLITSSNDGMRAIALSLGALSDSEATADEIVNDFVLKMNERAHELGLTNTYFLNETGLDVERYEEPASGGAYGTARDVSMLLQYILENNPQILSSTNESVRAVLSIDHNIHIARNTNPLAGEIPGLIGSKTGYTSSAGGNLSVIFDPELGRPIIISVLGSTEEGRFYDMRALVSATMKYISGN